MSWLGCERIELADCESTNDEAAVLARQGARHGTIVIARSQRAGRGRGGRTWSSPPGTGLYLSAVLRPALALEDLPPVTLAIGIGVCDAARSCGADASLKWPNDVLAKQRKLAGVLVEAQSHGRRLDAAIAGIGVNLTGTLPAEVAATAITLDDAAGVAGAHDPFVDRLLDHVERWIDRYVAHGITAILPAWTERMAPGLAARATIAGSAVVGEMLGLASDGALLLRDSDGRVHHVRSGDVEMIRAEHASSSC
jgi:BirA family biotin operon repressor/biotin-[acetyl-CoA-carboxylase] ligase